VVTNKRTGSYKLFVAKSCSV